MFGLVYSAETGVDHEDTGVSPLLLLLSFCAEANPVVKESLAKQLLRSKRQKPGYPDEPMREHMLYLQQLELRARETNLENWLNPHCAPRCNRNYGYPI